MTTRYFIVDAHEDLAYNALSHGRDMRRSAKETRAAEPESSENGLATLGLDDLVAGNVRVVFATIYVSKADPARRKDKTYTNAQEANLLAQEQLAYYALLAGDPRFSLITSAEDLNRVVESSSPGVGLVLLMEGADPIIEPGDAGSWYEAGVRIIGPAWSQTRYSGGTGKPGPLTDFGRELMNGMSRAGFILDTSHMAEEAFFQALDLFDGTVIASHSNTRKLVPTDRQLSDEMIKALVKRDAVIGAVFFNQFLQYQWRQNGADKKAVTFATVIDHMKHVCDLAGNASHCGIGTDFDGGFGMEATPYEIDTVADLAKFPDALANAGFNDAEIRGIMGGNWLRILKRGLPSRN